MQKFRFLTKSEEIDRAKDTLEKGLCFISKVSISDKPYDLVWHAGSNTYVYVEHMYLNAMLQKEQGN